MMIQEYNATRSEIFPYGELVARRAAIVTGPSEVSVR